MKLAIIGSRDFNDLTKLNNELEPYLSRIEMVVSGGAKGADKMGEEWAKRNNIKTLIFLAEWNKFGKSAGFIRNEDIIKNCDEVIAFWDGMSKGTKHSISLAEKFNKPCKIVFI